MKKKFSILILDDEGMHGSAQGHARVLTFLRNVDFTQPDDRLTVASGSTKCSGISQFDVEIWGGGTSLSFDDALDYVKEYDTRMSAFDLIFIDIKWDHKLNDDSETLVDDSWVNHANRLANADSSEKMRERVSKEVAGLLLFYEISKRARNNLKVIFSAATETVDIRYLIMAFFEDRIENQDFIIGNLADGKHWQRIKNKIEAELRKRRSNVLSLQSSEVLDKLMQRVNAFAVERKSTLAGSLQQVDSTYFDKIDILDNVDTRVHWTLASLFPRQVNTLLFKEPNRSEFDRAQQDIVDELYSYPQSLAELSRIKHPGHKSPTDYAVMKRLVQHRICHKEFTKAKDPEDRSALHFTPITQLIPAPDADNYPDKLHAVIGNMLTSSHVGGWSFSRTFAESFTQVDLAKALQYAGLYPGYIDYIYQIAEHNANKRNQQLVQASLSIANRNTRLLFRMKIADADTKDTQKWVTALRQKIDHINTQPIDLTLRDEGIGDLLDIVCHRYHGRFNFIRHEDRIECLRQPNARIANVIYSKKDKDTGHDLPLAAADEILYCIDLPMPFYPKSK